MNKTFNNKAWWLVLPVFLMVAFNALVPLMTVVNYSIQETFGNNEFFFEGVRWFQQVMQSARFREALLQRADGGLGRQAREVGSRGRHQCADGGLESIQITADALGTAGAVAALLQAGGHVLPGADQFQIG